MVCSVDGACEKREGRNHTPCLAPTSAPRPPRGLRSPRVRGQAWPVVLRAPPPTHRRLAPGTRTRPCRA
eukprot:365549-Chlamydomonas_euryale.AAC.5